MDDTDQPLPIVHLSHPEQTSSLLMAPIQQVLKFAWGSAPGHPPIHLSANDV